MNKEIKIIDDESKITCRVCGKRMVRVYRHLKAHDMTSEDYLKLYPNAPLTTAADAKNTTKNSGQHMKTEKYKKMFSEMFKGEKNPMHRSNTTEQQRKEISPFSVEFWKKRNPDWTEEQCVEAVKGTAAKAVKDRLIPTQKEYWVEKGHSEEEAIQKVSDYQRTFSKDICIEKYGEEEGLRVFNERQAKWNASLIKNGNMKSGYSQISQELFDKIIESYSEADKLGVYYATKNQEYFISEKNSKFYQYDFTDTNRMKIIEYNGDVYHANPNIYNENDYYHPFHKEKGLTAKEKWEEDKIKRKAANKRGFDVLTVWDSEFNQDKDQTIKKCLDFLFS